MSNATPNPGSAEESRFTVEDAGSTTNAADLFNNDTTAGMTGSSARPESTRDEDPIAEADATAGAGTPEEPAVPSAPGAPEAPSTPTGGLAALGDDDSSIGHVFDQTNGVIEGLDGDSDGTADSDDQSAAERADENPASLAFADAEADSGGGTDDASRTGN